MTNEEAITILENGEWWEIINGVLPADDAESMELREAVHVAISALRARQATAKLDRSRWKGCPDCDKWQTYGERNYEPAYCRDCGKPINEAAWAELERRINYGTTDNE